MNLASLRVDVRDKLSALRAIERLLDSQNVSIAFETADPDEVKQFKRWIDEGNAFEIRAWIKRKTSEELTTRQLRLRAAALQIPNYGRMSKAILLSSIYEKEHPNGESPTGIETDRRNETDTDGVRDRPNVDRILGQET